MKNRGIYKIINSANQHFYVGSSVNLSRRKSRHFSELRTQKHNNQHLQAAWNKYGEGAFEFVVVEWVDDVDKLLEIENKWLKEHVGKEYCYNMGRDATAPALGLTGELSPTWGYKHTEEAKARIGAASKGRTLSKEVIDKIVASRKGYTHSVETRQKLSNAAKGEANFWYGKARPEFAEKVRKAVYCPTNDTFYPSVRHARDALGLMPTTINRALKSGQPISRGPFSGWEFRYVEKQNAPEERNK